MTWRSGTWDYVTIDGTKLVGHVIKLDIAPMRNIETTPVPGLDGVDMRDQGYAGCPVTIGLELIKPAQFEPFSAQLATMHPRQPGVAIKPRKIEHPLCRMANITSIYVLGFTCGMPDADGKWQCEITAFQFAKAKKKIAPLDGGSLDIDTDVKPDPRGAGAHFTG
jgi:hypothetical protein